MISPGPTPTRSTATSGLPVSAPVVDTGWIHWSVTAASVSCLIVATTRPTTRASCTEAKIRGTRRIGTTTAALVPHAASVRDERPPSDEGSVLEQLHEDQPGHEPADMSPD